MSIDPTTVGENHARSKRNASEHEDAEDERDQLRERLDREEQRRKANSLALCVLAAQALGIPTQELFSFLLSIL